MLTRVPPTEFRNGGQNSASQRDSSAPRSQYVIDRNQQYAPILMFRTVSASRLVTHRILLRLIEVRVRKMIEKGELGQEMTLDGAGQG